MAIEDVLSWIDRRALTGRLVVERGVTRRDFAFSDRHATSVSSNLAGEQLGQLLLFRELISEDTLREALRVQTDTGVRLGKVLIMVGALDELRLREVLELELREALCDVLSWETGSFAFEPGGRRGSEVPIAVPLASTLELGVRQAERWREIRKLVPSDDLVFVVRDHFAAQDPGQSEQLAAQMTRLVDSVERGLSVGDMVREHHGRRFQVLTRLAELLSRGAIALPAAPRTSRRASSPPADVVAVARRRADAGDTVGALDLVVRSLEVDVENDELRALHAELERTLFASLGRELLGSFRVPKILLPARDLAALDLSEPERELIGRIDGRWDLLSLMRAASLRDVEALLTFKRLADRGIISL